MAEFCGQCNGKFSDEEAYLGHKCPETGRKPSDPTPDDDPIAQAALARGEQRRDEDAHPATLAQK